MPNFRHCVEASRLGQQTPGRRGDAFSNQIKGDLKILREMSRGLWPGTVKYRDIKAYYGLRSRSTIGAIPELQQLKRDYLKHRG